MGIIGCVCCADCCATVRHDIKVRNHGKHQLGADRVHRVLDDRIPLRTVTADKSKPDCCAKQLAVRGLRCHPRVSLTRRPQDRFLSLATGCASGASAARLSPTLCYAEQGAFAHLGRKSVVGKRLISVGPVETLPMHAAVARDTQQKETGMADEDNRHDLQTATDEYVAAEQALNAPHADGAELTGRVRVLRLPENYDELRTNYRAAVARYADALEANGYSVPVGLREEGDRA